MPLTDVQKAKLSQIVKIFQEQVHPALFGLQHLLQRLETDADDSELNLSSSQITSLVNSYMTKRQALIDAVMELPTIP